MDVNANVKHEDISYSNNISSVQINNNDIIITQDITIIHNRISPFVFSITDRLYIPLQKLQSRL